MCGGYSKDVIIYMFESITEWMQKKLLKICKTRLFRKGAHSFRADHPIVTLKKILKSTIFMDLRNAGGRTWTGTGLPPRDFKSLASAYSATPADASHIYINVRMDGGGFEPPKQIAADLQSVPFGHSGIHPCQARVP